MRNLGTLLSLLLLLLTVSGTAWGQTVTATLQMNAEAMSQPDVWLVGFDRGDSPAPAVFLRWVQVPSVFLPLWELQLAALPGILDPTVVTGESGGYEFITLPAGFSPMRGDEYVAQISFTPDGPRVAVSLENTSRAGERYSVQVPLRQWVELSTPWPADRVREEYPHIQTMRIGLDWTPLGLPLSMQWDSAGVGSRFPGRPRSRGLSVLARRGACAGRAVAGRTHAGLRGVHSGARRARMAKRAYRVEPG